MTTTATRKPRRPPITLEVVRTEQLGPHLVRVVVGGPGFREFEATNRTDMYVKLRFGDVTRTYTVREVDEAAETLSIDFVVHGAEGLAGPWAAAAEPGDSLTLSGPGGTYAPDPSAEHHVLLGDLSALPAIAASVVRLPREATGQVIVEAQDPGDRLPLEAPPGVSIRWVDAGGLFAAARALLWPGGFCQVFAHGERETMKELRTLMQERGVPREHLSLSGYWARGRTEDRFQAEKREPIGQIFLT